MAREAPTFGLVIRTPAEIVVDDRARSLTAEDETGRFGVRPRMEPLVAALVPGLLEYRDRAGVTVLVAVGGGMLHASRERVEVAVRHAVVCSSLERVREEVLAALAARRGGAAAMSHTFDALYKRLVLSIADEERGR